MRTLIKDCRLVSPGTDMQGASVFAEGGTIRRIFLNGEKLPGADLAFDAGGAVAMPGFVDIHVHGAAGFDFMEADVQGMHAFMQAKLKEGVTTILPTTGCVSEENLSKSLQCVSDYGSSHKPVMPKIAGIHLEGPYVSKKSIGALNPAFARPPDIEEIRRLDRIAKIKIVSLAIELDGAGRFIEELAAMGIAASCAHSGAGYAQMKEAMALGVRQLTHFCNQMTPLHHREVGLVGAGLLEDELLLQLICDRIHLSGEMIRLVFKVKPADKIALITDSVSASWSPDGDIDLGGLAATMKDGVVRLKSNGALAGSTLRFNHGLRNVAELTGLPLDRLSMATSLNQAILLGIGNIGRLEPGFLADIVILDDNFEILKVFVDGAPAI